MAPRQFHAPRVWKRPLTTIYSDNYRYGNSLYAPALDEIERKYHESMARTHFRSDRPDLGFSTLGGQTGNYSSRPGSPIVDFGSNRSRRINMETELQGLSRSLSATRLGTSFLGLGPSPSASDLKRSSSFHAYESARALADIENGLESSRARRHRRRPESVHFVDELVPRSPRSHSRHRSMPPHHSMDLEAETHNSNIWMDRWYKVGVPTGCRLVAIC
ncbi:uncharacterized protein LOC141849180 [Brevipalpus obovatus]|uniref:uncharacterized protein LOC141849180 n=1 Tax=Brevipalpus obovatus TaxID=246614 RepID=UPI003D9F198B